MKNIKHIFSLLILFCAPSIIALESVKSIDLNKYMGKWYEIARFDSWFEKDCVNVTAEYTLNGNIVDVLNTCRLKTPHGKYKEAKGRAIVVRHSNNAKLKVSFLPNFLRVFDRFFSGDYWILKIEPDYSVVLVGEPSKKYLWILSRTSKIDPTTYKQYVKYAESLGFDVSKLHQTMQK